MSAKKRITRSVRALLVLGVCVLWVAPSQASVRDKQLDLVIATLEQHDLPVAQRQAAALELVQLKGEKAAGTIFDVATGSMASYPLQTALAPVLSELDSDKVQAKLRKLLGSSRADVRERLFALAALRRPATAREARTLFKLFESDDALLRREALRTAVRLDVREALPVLQDLLRSTRRENELEPAGGAWLDALIGLHEEQPELMETLLEHAHSPLRSVRTAAVRQIAERLRDSQPAAQTRDRAADSRPSVFEPIEDPGRRAPVAAHDPAAAAAWRADPRVHALLSEGLRADDWQDRHAAVQLAGSLPPLIAVEALLSEAPIQTGRMRVEFDDALAALTGKAFQRNFERWQRWWTQAGRPALENPESVVAASRQPPRSTLENRGLNSIAAPMRFFELSVDSHNVVFVVDVSGSMGWPASFIGEPVGNTQPECGPDSGPSRMQVACEQLSAAVQGVHPDARLNLIVFNDRARVWLDRRGLADYGKAGKRAEDALEFIDGLVPTDGTNLYGGLQAAFQDPAVDTIYVLSDGVASLGDFLEPELIRRSVLAWNDHREVIVHSVVMGLDAEQHPLAMQLADDSGGAYVSLP